LLDGITVGVTTLPVVPNAVSSAALLEDKTEEYKDDVIDSRNLAAGREYLHLKKRDEDAGSYGDL
jgi:hypothetical protein